MLKQFDYVFSGWYTDCKVCQEALKNLLFILKACFFIVKGLFFILKACFFIVEGLFFILKACFSS